MELLAEGPCDEDRVDSLVLLVVLGLRVDVLDLAVDVRTEDAEALAE